MAQHRAPGSPRLSVLLAAGGAAWEAPALGMLGEAGVVVLKRCVDVTDLLGTVGAGQADVAVVDGGLSGLDADAMRQVAEADVRVVALSGADDAERLRRLGVTSVVHPDALDDLAAAVEAAAHTVVRVPDLPAHADAEEGQGRVIAVWGPTGAPGRTTVAVNLAAIHAGRHGRALLLDIDAYGGAVAQHLGILDEASGLLAAARRVNEGTLDRSTFASCRRLVPTGLEVLTGLPRADRWIEVRSGVLNDLLDLAVFEEDVFLDCGFGVEESLDGGRGRNQLTLEALGSADTVVLVGSAEPTGLARLARALVDVRDLRPDAEVHVVVNRMRDTLGWRRQDIVGMIDGYARVAGVHFVAEDQATLDRALVAGKAVTELGDSPVRRDLQALADQLEKSRNNPVPV